MITHYDMTTGEVITDDEGIEQPHATTTGPETALALRLLTVEEATATQVTTSASAACVAMLPVELLLSGQP